MYQRPYEGLMPPLSVEEYELLRLSIEHDGVLVPVVVDEYGNVLDGHHRLSICPEAPVRVHGGLTAAEKLAFVYGSNLARRQLSAAQRQGLAPALREAAQALREENPVSNTQARIAGMLGVSQSTVSRWCAGEDEGGTIIHVHNGSASSNGRLDARVKIPSEEAVLERVESGESTAQIAEEIGVTDRAVRKAAQRARKRKSEPEEVPAPEVTQVDFREIQIEPESIDLIFTRPVQDGSDSVRDFVDLSVFAAQALKPGGWCLAFAGTRCLPDVIEALTSELEYGWVFSCLGHWKQAKVKHLGIESGWNPLVGCYKPPLRVWWKSFEDVMCCGGRRGEMHPWQWNAKEANYYIEALCPEGGVVFDPLCGDGSTLWAATAAGRRCMGCDSSKRAVEQTVRILDKK